MTDKNIQQDNFIFSSEAVASLILGIISAIIGIGLSFFLLIEPPAFIKSIYIYILENTIRVTIFTIFNSSISLISIILGKIGLKSTKKGFAIAGIILSILGLLGSLFFYFFIIMMASTF